MAVGPLAASAGASRARWPHGRGLGWLLALLALCLAASLLGRAASARSVSRPAHVELGVGVGVGIEAGSDVARASAPSVPAAGRTLLASSALSGLRPGGGHTYGGGSSSGSGSSSGGWSSSGSSDGAGDLIGALIYLCIEVPELGIPLTVIVIVVVIVGKRRQARRSTDTYDVMTTLPDASAVQTRTVRAGGGAANAVAGPAAVKAFLGELRRTDPGFSLVLFEDFLYALYAAVHEARGGDKLFNLQGYVAAGAAQALALRPRHDVEGVVIGSMRYEKARRRHEGGHEWIDVKVRFESNFTEREADGSGQTLYVVEDWQLSRRADVKSKPADKARVLGCPNCGGPHDGRTGNLCRYCGKTVDTGVFDWAVVRIDLIGQENRPPQLTGDAPEVGTNAPTIVTPGAEQRFKALSEADPSFSWGAFQTRVGRVFEELQRAWSSQSWEAARPFVSDQLFQMQQYWIESYQRARLRNVTENARIVSMTVADVRSDAHYDALTVRVFATGLDYTLDEGGKVVAGSKKRERQYSEYWTLVRGRARGEGQRACPSCGAPLTINMAGQCSHCQARVNTADFDWVLSRIEQDESYRG